MKPFFKKRIGESKISYLYRCERYEKELSEMITHFELPKVVSPNTDFYLVCEETIFNRQTERHRTKRHELVLPQSLKSAILDVLRQERQRTQEILNNAEVNLLYDEDDTTTHD